MKYLSTFETAEKWGISHRHVSVPPAPAPPPSPTCISHRHVSVLCNQGRISGAQRAGSRWIIPEDAEKPADARIKSGKYIKERAAEGGT